jgi:hypothetical protein
LGKLKEILSGISNLNTYTKNKILMISVLVLAMVFSTILVVHLKDTTSVHRATTGNSHVQLGATFETSWVQSSTTDEGQWWVTIERYGNDGWEFKGLKDNDWLIFQRRK